MVLVEVCGTTYHVADQLYAKWEKIKDGKLAKLDDDKDYVVDGRERSGKSVFTMQQAGVIDPLMFKEAIETKKLPTICFTGEELLWAVRHTKSTPTRTRVVIFDEAFRGLASSSVLSKTNRMIVQALMEMGQNNIVLFIVLPSFFLLDRYPAVLRSNALFHIQKEKANPKKRVFYVYNYHKKAALYHMGVRKGWGYPVFTKERGRFYGKYPGGDEFEKLYKQKKMEAFREIEGTLGALGGEVKESARIIQRNALLDILNKKFEMNPEEISRDLTKAGIEFSNNAIREAIKTEESRKRAGNLPKPQK